MRVIVTKNYEEMSRKAANIIAAQVVMKPDSVLGLATGSSPIGAYKLLVEGYKKGDLDFSEITSINLDEYVGLSADHNQSYAYFMRDNLFNHVNINMDNVFLPNGMETDEAKECARYDEVIRSRGPIDLQLLGLGENGHIGFNEPDSSFAKGTHKVSLTESTINANSRLFNSIDEVPKFAYSMGVGSIFSAKHILLIASGEKKADALCKALYGPVTPEVPASALQFHSNVTIVADEAAYALIAKMKENHGR